MTDATDDADLHLLRRYRPVLRLDAQEAYRCLSVRAMVEAPGNSLQRADGTPLLQPEAKGIRRLT